MKFPALTFSQGLINFIYSTNNITRCTRAGFKSGFYKELLVVDSEGQKFRVTDVRKIRTLPYKFNMGGFLALISWNPDWEIELIFAPTPSKISLEELKKMIFKSFRKELDMWEENTDFEEFRDKLSAVTSIEQIFAIFGEVYRKSHHE